MKEQAQWAGLRLAVLASIVLVTTVACGDSSDSPSESGAAGGAGAAIDTDGSAGTSLDVRGKAISNNLGKAGAMTSEEVPIGLHGKTHDTAGAGGKTGNP